MEDKTKILKLLLPALQATRVGKDIVSLEYTNLSTIYDEVVSVKWKDGYIQIVNVSADSGAAMISDILRRIRNI